LAEDHEGSLVDACRRLPAHPRSPWRRGAVAPRLVRQGRATQLVVQGKPMLLIAGEIGNSSASSAAYLTAHRATLVPEMKRMWEGDTAAEVFTAWN